MLFKLPVFHNCFFTSFWVKGASEHTVNEVWWTELKKWMKSNEQGSVWWTPRVLACNKVPTLNRIRINMIRTMRLTWEVRLGGMQEWREEGEVGSYSTLGDKSWKRSILLYIVLSIFYFKSRFIGYTDFCASISTHLPKILIFFFFWHWQIHAVFCFCLWWRMNKKKRRHLLTTG